MKAYNEMSYWGTVRTFRKVGTCSETLCNVVNRAYDQPLLREEKSSAPLAGGIMKQGYQCGMLWGASLAAGSQAYRRYGAGAQAEAIAIVAAQRIVELFRSHYKHIDCRDLTGTDWRKPSAILTYFLKGGIVRCFHMAGKYAPVAVEAIEGAFAQKLIEVPQAPVSCAAVVTKKLGASEMHTTMAAGLAGGIGLCGGGCGALGAAVWLAGLEYGAEKSAEEMFENPKAKELIEKFLACTGGKFLCADIAGRMFANVNGHAEYLRAGGCSEVIAALAMK